jgi:hypothetical protein
MHPNILKTANIGMPPIGIIITQGAQVVDANGGMAPFLEHFRSCLDGGSYWLHKSRAAPIHDIAHVYLVIDNIVWGKAVYGGFSRQSTTVTMLNGEVRAFPWPHMILGGPVERCPYYLPMRGFQGFRYVYELIW